MNNVDQSFGEYLLSLGIITHFGTVTGEKSSKLACNHNARKVASVTNVWANVTCRQCQRIHSRWNRNPELAAQFGIESVV